MGGCEVPVNQTSLGSHGQSTSDFATHSCGFVTCKRTVSRDSCLKADPIHVLHYQVRRVVIHLYIEDVNDILMLDCRRCPGLPNEAFSGYFVRPKTCR